MNALLVPVEGPVEGVELDGTLEQLQALVGGGFIQAVPLPSFIRDHAYASAYVNDDGKALGLGFNGRATDFLLPGVGMFLGDYVAGPMLLVGFDPVRGEHAELPASVVRRIRLIEREAS